MTVQAVEVVIADIEDAFEKAKYMVEEYFLERLRSGYIYQQEDWAVEGWRGFSCDPIMSVKDIPDDYKVDNLIVDYILWTSQLWTGKRYIDNPDWNGNVKELAGDDGYLVLIRFHR